MDNASSSEEAHVRRSPPVPKCRPSHGTEKRTIHVLQNRTTLFALDTADTIPLLVKTAVVYSKPSKAISYPCYALRRNKNVGFHFAQSVVLIKNFHYNRYAITHFTSRASIHFAVLFSLENRSSFFDESLYPLFIVVAVINPLSQSLYALE